MPLDGQRSRAGRPIGRRRLLKTALGGLAGASLPALGLTACSRAAAGDFPVTELGERLMLVSGVPGNVVVLSTSDGRVVVDTGAPEHADALAAQIRALPGRGRMRAVFNTHYHLDQTGGNAVVAGDGAPIIAHAITRQWLATDTYAPFEDRWVSARPEAAWPTETFYETGAIDTDGERVEYGYLLQAHTAGDIYVFFRNANVLAVGDAVSPERDPALDWFAGGWLGARVEAMQKLLALADEETRIVPAYGPVMTRADLAAETEMMTALWERLNTLIRQGRSAEDMLAAGVLDETGREWSDPQAFLYDASKGLWAHQISLAADIL